MKNVTHRVKLEERQEQYEKTELPLSAKKTRPQFLSKDLLSLSKPNQLPDSYRPRSICTGLPVLTGNENEYKAIDLASSKFRTTPQEDIPTGLGNQHKGGGLSPARRMMRRRSCCCTWCGGESKLETKHKDVVVAPGKAKEKSLLLKLNLVSNHGDKVSTPINRFKHALSKRMKDNTPSSMRNGATPKAVNSKDKLSNFHVPDSHPVTNTKLEQSSKGTSHDSTVRHGKDPTPGPVSKAILRETGGELKPKNSGAMNQQTDSEDEAFWAQAKGILKPVKLHRDFGISAIQARRRDQNEKKLSPDLPSINNMNTSTPVTQNKAINVMQRLYRNIIGHSSASPEKIAKLTMPMGSALAEKIRARNAAGLDSPERESKGSLVSYGNSKGRFTLLNSDIRIKTEDTMETERNIRFSKPLESPKKSSYRSSGDSPLKSQVSFRTTNAKIKSIYEEKMSVSVQNNKTVTSRRKRMSPVGRATFDTQNVLFMSTVKTETSKFSFAEISKDLEELEGKKKQSHSPRLKKMRKRKNIKLVYKEELPQWTPKTLSLSKSNSHGIDSPVLYANVYDKMVKTKGPREWKE